MDVLLDNNIVHVQDVDVINMIAKVGAPDKNDIVWSYKWVDLLKLNLTDNDNRRKN